MRRGSYALGIATLIAGHAFAVEPSGSAQKPNAPPAAPAAPGSPAGPAAPKTSDGPQAPDAPPPEFYVEPGGAAAPASPAAPTPVATPGNATPAPPGAPPPPAGPPPTPPGPPPPPPPNLPGSAIYEPPPPGFEGGVGTFEPPPPPEPHHVAPRTALWLGARVGWFIPFGSAWARGTPDNAGNLILKGVPWRDYVSSGPMFELDLGARLSRNYNVFALWERAQLGDGHGDPNATGVGGHSSGGDTDFWGLGIRATSDADRVGLVTELAIGYRRARATYQGTEIQFTDAPFEARLGIGADVRVNPIVTLTPLVTVGVGSFGTVERVSGNTVVDHTGPDDRSDGHAWATLTVGGSFDLFGSYR